MSEMTDATDATDATAEVIGVTSKGELLNQLIEWVGRVDLRL